MHCLAEYIIAISRLWVLAMQLRRYAYLSQQTYDIFEIIRCLTLGGPVSACPGTSSPTPPSSNLNGPIISNLGSKPALVPTPAAAAPLPPPPPPPPREPSWVTFEVHAITIPGEIIHLTGDLGELRYWNSDTPIPLICIGNSLWTVTLSLPGSTTFSYKYMRKWNGPVNAIQGMIKFFGSPDPPPLRWEPDPNRSYTTPESGCCTISGSWR
ncbi:hypothetical protein FRC04_004038 [Tulasnella sp. 424]|nr:hypothetical protein FRC04_004038 [Tulasnella sp. 424]